jgi:hypothetical protein
MLGNIAGDAPHGIRTWLRYCFLLGECAKRAPSATIKSINNAEPSLDKVDSGTAPGIGGGAVLPRQVTVALNGAGTGPELGVCVQESRAVWVLVCSVQLKPIAGAFTPTTAGASISREAPEVIWKFAEPAGILQSRPSEATAVPDVSTSTAIEPRPLIRPTLEAPRAAVGDVPAAAAGQLMGQERAVGPALPLKSSLQLSMPLLAAACAVQVISIEPFGAAKVGLVTVNAEGGKAGDAGLTAQLSIVTEVPAAKSVAIASMLPVPEADSVTWFPVAGR